MSGKFVILKNIESGYKPLVDFEQWRVAVLNFFDIVDLNHLNRVERHNLSDEVFVLTAGEAFLIVEKEDDSQSFDILKMKQEAVYNIKKNVWHHIILREDTSVLIVENSNTGSDNTDYMDIVSNEIASVKATILDICEEKERY